MVEGWQQLEEGYGEGSVEAVKSLGRDSRHILRKGVSVEVCKIY